ncbi:hypothetical protein PpBr36_04197 [Pyricularia pennisetigena]|uniref:hypothetical protein n=1 Tax=Pyricularia pennisetigena TaxID=1578925 RepID=UPI001153595A|nr:hypothetical protein PpBr36_04197 [Pyricularia pennisetigena]TLS26473.1 hypothetical protein PpBr36_04197 [Pyricularia pennisetigena]
MRPFNLITALAVSVSGAQALAVPRGFDSKLAAREIGELHASDPNPVLVAREINPRFLPQTPTTGDMGGIRQKCSTTAAKLGKIAHKCGTVLEKIAQKTSTQSGGYFAGQPSQYADLANHQGQSYSQPAAGPQYPASQQIYPKLDYQQSGYQ